MGREPWKSLGVLALAALFIIPVSVLAIWGMVGWLGMSYSDSARLFQAVGAVSVIFVGGALAYQRLQIFRTFEPHLSISQEISHRLVGGDYLHLVVTADLHNNSKVKVELREAFFSLLVVAPTDNDDIERLYREVFVTKMQEYLQWPTLNEVPRRWEKGEIVIEPGERHQEVCEFIVSEEVESVLAYTFFHNPEVRDEIGWSATTVYDVIDLSKRVSAISEGGDNAG